MKAQDLADTCLLSKAKSLAQSERTLTLELLEHIREIETRKLFAKLGHSSILKYLVQELKYSEGQAYRRMQAARLLGSVPEVKQDLSSGALNLSHACQVERFGRQERLDSNQKRSLIKAVQGKSSQQVTQTLFELSGKDYSLPDQRKQVSATKTELRLCLDRDTLARLDRVKELMASKQLTQDSAVINYVLEFFLKLKDPMEKIKQAHKVTQFQQHEEKLHKNLLPMASNEQFHHKKSGSKSQRYVSATAKQQVWLRAKGKCEFQFCDERYGLEIDHVRPIKLGGNSELDNLRLLCRQHNQWAIMNVRKKN